MKRVRIPLDLEEDLRDYFKARLDYLGDNQKVTKVLRYAMYKMISMENEELKKFLSDGEDYETLYMNIKPMLTKAKEEGHLSQEYRIGNPKDQKLFGIFMAYNNRFINEEQMEEEVRKHLEE